MRQGRRGGSKYYIPEPPAAPRFTAILPDQNPGMNGYLRGFANRAAGGAMRIEGSISNAQMNVAIRAAVGQRRITT